MKTTFTYDDVKGILCKYCRQRILIPYAEILDNNTTWLHHIRDGEYVKCKANRWRNKAAHLEDSKHENPSNPTSPV